MTDLFFRVRHAEEAVPALSREDLLAARLRPARVISYQRSTTPLASDISLALCSGLLLILAFPDWNLWSLAWVGTAPLIMAAARTRRFWRGLLLGTITGTVFYVGTSYWVTYSMHNYGGIALWLCYLIGVVFAAALGVFTGLFAGVVAFGVRRFGGWALISAPVVWPATEWARLKITGLGWNALGYSQALQHPAVIQLARFGGVYAVSALLVLVSTAVVFSVIYLERKRGVLVFSISGVIAAGAVVYGTWAVQDIPIEGSLRVAVVQPNVPITDSWNDSDFVAETARRYIALSEQALHRERPPSADQNSGGDRNDAPDSDSNDLVVWPEAQINFEYERDPDLRQIVGDFTRRNRVYLLLNSWSNPDGRGPRNAAFVIAPSGEKISEYDKIALVPFGEYVPLRGVIPFMNGIPALVADVTPGDKIELANVAAARLGSLICFEATRPEIARAMRHNGASALVQISNEAWFGPTSASRQMLAHAVFRAVENDVELVRATNSGLSALVDEQGRVDDLTPSFQTAVRNWTVKSVQQARPETFYARHGDLFAITCAAASGLGIVACIVQKLSGRGGV
ncbi:MAG TPA: apolipoprotein N-acyltransferase [Blastocatellia bacterium]|nr:apolipoprotein N-acyltransferase [Blastocatellia bacterium]